MPRPSFGGPLVRSLCLDLCGGFCSPPVVVPSSVRSISICSHFVSVSVLFPCVISVLFVPILFMSLFVRTSLSSVFVFCALFPLFVHRLPALRRRRYFFCFGKMLIVLVLWVSMLLVLCYFGFWFLRL